MAQHDDLGLASVQPAAITPDAEPSGSSWPSERFVLIVWAVLTVAVTVLWLHAKEQDALKDPAQQAARGEVTGLGPLSLLRADRFAAAVAAVQSRAPDGRVLRITVDPTSASFQLRTPGDAVEQLDVDAGLKVSLSATGETNARSLPFAKVDAGIPERLVRAVNVRSHTTPEDVGRVALSVDGFHPADSRWIVTLAKGVPPDQRQYSADVDGAHLRQN